MTLDQSPLWPQLAATLNQALTDAQHLDLALTTLRADGRAQFRAIFRDDAGFETSADRFVPYVNELMLSIDALRDEPQWQQPLAQEVKKLHLLLQTIARTSVETGLYENQPMDHNLAQE